MSSEDHNAVGKSVVDMTPDDMYGHLQHLMGNRNMSTPEQSLLKHCSWCNRKRRFAKKSDKYCLNCTKTGRPCTTCKRPLGESAYSSSNKTICMTCEGKKTRQRGGNSKKALGDTVHETFLGGGDDIVDYETFLIDCRDRVEQLINQKRLKDFGVKFYCVLRIKFRKYQIDDSEPITAEACLRHCVKTVMDESNIHSLVLEGFAEISENVRKYQRDGSGWVVNNIVGLDVKIVPYRPLRGKSYLELPEALKSKRAIVNVKNTTDQECFKWSVLVGLFTERGDKHSNRVSYLKRFERKLNFDGLAFPTPVNEIDKFEKNNPEVSINVYGYDKEEYVYPLRISKKSNCVMHHVNLLLYYENETYHYTCITNMSRLFSNRTKHSGATYICNRCLHPFSSQRVHDKHLSYCLRQDAQRVDLPEEDDKILTFKNYFQTLKVPFVIYADFECFLEPVDHGDNDQDSSNTHIFQNHVPASFCYYKVRCDGADVGDPVLYKGPGVVDHFYECLLDELATVHEDLKNIVPMQLSVTEEAEFQKANSCFICGKHLGVDRVRHHCHVTGEFFGAAHNNCNIQVKFRKGTQPNNKPRLPVIIHNSKHYDTHILMEGLGKFAGDDLNIGCIPNNKEKYISFNLGELVFIDSMQFLNSSLAKLVDTLEDNQFTHLTKYFPNDLNILRRKGVFCYDYFTDQSVFHEKKLPPKECFYSKLTERDISNEDYAHAVRIWKHFGMQTFAEYHDLYLKLDVLLLADVFEQFRTFSMATYQLDPAHFYTSPGLAWQAMLKKTGIELELLTDMEQYMFVESGIRGGLTFIGKRYCKANHEQCDDYDKDKDKVYISYQDANNLYGCAMRRPLPVGGFHFLPQDQVLQFNKDKILNIDEEGPMGYIFEVDLDYPAHLHDTHSCYPMAPESMAISDDMLSDLQIELKTELHIEEPGASKLITNLLPKKNYIVHHSTLKTYLEHGLILSHVHKILSFNQSPWLKPYIDLNSDLRKQAKNDFQKQLAKLFNNAIFGKSMENVRKRCDVKLVTSRNNAIKLASTPRYKGFSVFNEDLVGVEMKRSVIKADRPMYLGFTILEESKVVMYKYHYDVIKPFYGKRATLLYTDTDSLIYELHTQSLTDDYRQLIDHLDTSNYPPNHELKSDRNKSVVGKFKDEVAGQMIGEFVALKPKMYSMKMCQTGQESMRAKGVGRAHVEDCFRHEMYLDCLRNKNILKCSFSAIRSKNHKLATYRIRKIGLSCYDSKRYLLADGIHTLPYGHCDIR